MEPIALPRVLQISEQGCISLDHPFPIVAVPQHLLQVDDFVCLSAGDIRIGISGWIVSFDEICYQNRRLSNDQFLLKVAFIEDTAKSLKISVPHPNGIDYLYGNIPIGSVYFFNKYQISYVGKGSIYLPVFPLLFLQRNGFERLQINASTRFSTILP